MKDVEGHERPIPTTAVEPLDSEASIAEPNTGSKRSRLVKIKSFKDASSKWLLNAKTT